MFATGLGMAGVVGAGVAIVAIEGHPTLADSSSANFARCAGITVVAGNGVVGIHTAQRTVASVVGAEVAVVAVEDSAALTLAACTEVAGSALTAVVTREGIVGMQATDTWVALVVGA
jgi:hypothetical protein